MYLALFALLSSIGAWAAWRSNPLYSAGATLRFVAIVGLAIAATIAAIIAVVNLTANRSPAVITISLLAIVLLGTCALIWIIIALTSPHLPKLAPGTVAVRIHRDKIRKWTQNLVIVLIALKLVAHLLPGNAEDVAYGVEAFVLLIGGVMLFAGYLAARNFDLALTTVETNPWAHWRYTPEQWQAWIDVEVNRVPATQRTWSWQRDWKRLLPPAGILIAAVYLFDPGSWLFKSAYLGGVVLIMVLVVLSSNHYARTAPRRVRAILTSAGSESYFGAAGVFADGTFSQWQTVAKYLTSATLDERAPRSIVLQFTEIPPGAGSPFPVYQNVLVASDAGDDLAQLQTRISAACPSASVTIVAATTATSEATSVSGLRN